MATMVEEWRETVLTETRADQIQADPATAGKAVQIGEVEIHLSIEKLS